MTLTDLKYIVALARERHFGRAAKACFVSQPTLSVAVKKLEEQLDVALFERKSQEVTPTPTGRLIVEQAARVLEAADEVKHLAGQGRNQLDGPIRLGAIYTIGPYLYPHLIPAMRKLAPKMPMLVEENYTSRLAERLRAGDLDAIVISTPFSEPGVVVRVLYEEPFVVAFPAGHEWKKRSTVGARELAKESLLLLGSGHCFRDQVLKACPALNRTAATGSLQKTLEGSSLETIRHMVASGAGVTVLPCSSTTATGAESRLLTMRPFTDPAPVREVALAWRVSFPRPKAMDAIAEAILSVRINCLRMRRRAGR
jgi:LysR family hydrogen peroxide-inducible transcriptional activator